MPSIRPVQKTNQKNNPRILKTAPHTSTASVKFRIFIFCFLIATLFWFIRSLTTDFSRTLKLQLVFTNIPPDVSLLTDIDDSVAVTLSGNGWKFLAENPFGDLRKMTVDLGFLRTQKPGMVSVALSPFVRSIPQFSSAGIRVVRVFPDSIRISFSGNAFRKVRIAADCDIRYKVSYMAGGPLTVIPDSIEVYGDEAMLQTIDSVLTARLVLNQVSARIDTLIPLILPAGLRTAMRHQNVRIRIPVSEWVEKKFIIRPKPDGELAGKIFLVDDRVTLTCRIPLEKAGIITAADFSVTALAPATPSANYVRLVVDKKPAFSEVFDLSPSFAEAYWIQ